MICEKDGTPNRCSLETLTKISLPFGSPLVNDLFNTEDELSASLVRNEQMLAPVVESYADAGAAERLERIQASFHETLKSLNSDQRKHAAKPIFTDKTLLQIDLDSIGKRPDPSLFGTKGAAAGNHPGPQGAVEGIGICAGCLSSVLIFIYVLPKS